jgi:LacI family transcriptional regulator
MAGAIRALHQLDIQIGTDISFVGCDNVLVAELHQPPIAVVYRDAGALGAAGASMLLSALGDLKDTPIGDVVLPTEFMVTPSCGPPPHR